jgi:DNA-binding HxlR family transcriptional regulator
MDVVCERWALLIVRNLLVRPQRYTDLRHGLPRIPTNVLAVRLKELERADVIRRRVLPRPAGAVIYELTEYGRDLEEAVLALGRWGARSLGAPRPDEIVTTDSLIMALRSTFRPAAARGRAVRFELRFGDAVLHAVVDHGRLHAVEGAATDPDLVIHAGPALPAVMSGEIGPAEAVERGLLSIDGDPRLLARFVDTFRVGPPAAAGDPAARPAARPSGR